MSNRNLDPSQVVITNSGNIVYRTGVSPIPKGEPEKWLNVKIQELEREIDAIPGGKPGPPGPQGIPGMQGPQGEPGKDGVDGLPGPKGEKGDKGDKGGSVHIQGSFDSKDDLPNPPKDTTDAYLIHGELWVWDEKSSSWHNVGHIQGPQGPAGKDGAPGPKGPQGERGPQGNQGPHGVAGPQGPKGDTGTTGPTGPQGQSGKDGAPGPKGDRGASARVVGAVSKVEDLPTPPETDGDMYTVDGVLYSWVKGKWTDAGNMRGPMGEPGPEGQEGPPGVAGEVGPQGPQGDPGPKGDKGGSVHIKGVVNSPHDLPTPPSDPDDAYLCKGDLWVWEGSNWMNVGHIQGPQGAPGPRGARGAQGPRGNQGPRGPSGGGLPAFILDIIMSIIVSTVTSTVMSQVNAEIDAAINEAITAMTDALNDMVNDAVEKALEEMGDELKGEKGDKGDKGDDGKDGRTFKIVGTYDYLFQFMNKYDAIEDNIGLAALIPNTDTGIKHIWAITGQYLAGQFIHATYEDFGELQGPKGEDATWNVSFMDKDHVVTETMEVDSDLPGDVPSMYLIDSKDIKFKTFKGSGAGDKPVGYSMELELPIPKLVKEDEATQFVPSTEGKVLSNDGEKLKWIDAPNGVADGRFLIRSEDGKRSYELTVDDDGRLEISLTPDTTDRDDFIIESPGGKKFKLSVTNSGRLKVEESVI